MIGLWKNLCSLLVFAALFGGDFARAEESCETRDYRAALGPARDQDNIAGWCFALTAADMITQATGVRVSSFDIAASVYSGDEKALLSHPDRRLAKHIGSRKEFFENLRSSRELESRFSDPRKMFRFILDAGGHVESALLMANAKGLCGEADLQSTTSNELLDAISFVHRRVTHRMTKQSSPRTDRVAWSERLVKNSMIDVADRFCRRALRTKAFIPHVKALAGGAEELTRMIERRSVTTADVARFVFGEVDRALDSGRIAAIDYNLNTIAVPGWNDPKHAEHSSPIVARKLIGGKCMYLVRNVFGTNCRMYRKKFAERCEGDGSVWVEREDLSASAYSVTTLN